MGPRNFFDQNILSLADFISGQTMILFSEAFLRSKTHSSLTDPVSEVCWTPNTGTHNKKSFETLWAVIFFNKELEKQKKIFKICGTPLPKKNSHETY
jgi:hypothetical protein